MGTDRIHHGFWRFHDPAHPKYVPGNPSEHAIRDYYRYLDGEIGSVLSLAGPETAILVVSDHGAKKMDGGICVNEWLLREGWLSLAEPRPAAVTALEKLAVDWANTRTWGEGGYYARIFLNVAGREPQGTILPEAYEQVRSELAEALQTLPGPRGEAIGTKVYRPETIYRQVKGVAPDLIVYWGDLHWRSVGSLGHPAVWTLENDTGPDDANHAPDGIWIYADPMQPAEGHELRGLDIMDFAPTVLDYFGVPIPADMQGQIRRL
jgi:predicted AlkP superfamily phosphohydrolase/phosphomutase